MMGATANAAHKHTLPASLADIYITDQLAHRPPGREDHLQAKIALQELNALMSNAPDEVLPRFVALAMHLTGGISAGLSILEPDNPKVFRWRNLCGSLKAFEGACTPLDDSPCGITLAEAGPVLTRHSEPGYRWIADTNVSLPEVLLVPLFIDRPEPLGTLWVVSNDEGHFDSGDARVVTELASFVGVALKLKRNEERLRSALGAQELLTKEMNHRLKNVFAVTQSIVRLGVKDARDKQDMAEVLSGRLQALATAHALVLPALADRDDRPLDLQALLNAILQPHHSSSEDGTRFVLHGPSFECHQHAAKSIALVFHELATNAVKYGALQSEAGRVDLRWQLNDGRLVFTWREAGGPSVSAPSHVGFGSKLVDASVRELKGTIEYDWRHSGVSILVSWPADEVGKLFQLR